jgi:cysteine desulfurase
VGLRSGTQAVPAIAALGIAAELAAQEMSEEVPRLMELRDRLFDLLADVPELVLTGDRLHRLPHHVSFYMPHADEVGMSGKTMVRHLNFAGIAISSGSACNSGKLKPSPVLVAMGYGDRAAKSGIRLTLGRQTTLADVEWTAMVIRQVLGRLMPQPVCC